MVTHNFEERTLKKKAGIESNPWANISRKRNISQGRRELTSDELSVIIRTATGELHILFAIGIYTGLRLGDCCTLRWSEVDLARGLIMRIPNKTARTSAKPVHIPIHPQLGTLLQRLRSTRPRARALLPERAGTQAETNDRHQSASAADYVLPETAENYLSNPYAVTTEIQKHFEHCGIRTHKPDTGYVIKENARGKKLKIFTGKRAVVEVGFHSFRHSFVSLCRETNAPLSVVEAIVGHSNPAMTRHYTHVGELAATRAVAALPALITPESETSDKKTDKSAESSDPLKIIGQIVSTMTPETCLNDKCRLLKILKANYAAAIQS